MAKSLYIPNFRSLPNHHVKCHFSFHPCFFQIIGHVTQMSFVVVVELLFASPLMLYVMVWMTAQMAKMRNLNSVVCL